MSSRLIKKTRGIYMEPINQVLTEINNANGNNIILLGEEGTGKTLVLKEYLQRYSNDPTNPVIDVAPKYGEFVFLTDLEVFDLSQTCLVVQKLLLYMKEHFPNVYESKFLELENKVTNHLRSIYFMYMVQNYQHKYKRIDPTILKNPHFLIEEFICRAMSFLDYNKMTVVIDDFDVLGSSCKYYQTYMYELLAKYFRIIITASDKVAVTDEDRRSQLQENNELVDIKYSYDVSMVKDILDTVFVSDFTFRTNITLEKRVRFIFSDEEIALMIEKTNGNLFDMMTAVRQLYFNINVVPKEEYGQYVINYIDKEINKNPILSGHIKLERKLYI